ARRSLPPSWARRRLRLGPTARVRSSTPREPELQIESSFSLHSLSVATLVSLESVEHKPEIIVAAEEAGQLVSRGKGRETIDSDVRYSFFLNPMPPAGAWLPCACRRPIEIMVTAAVV